MDEQEMRDYAASKESSVLAAAWCFACAVMLMIGVTVVQYFR